MQKAANMDTSWEREASWYDELLGEKGSYYHQHVVFPRTVELLSLKKGMRVLDLACGQGAFSRRLVQKGCIVTGVDKSTSLIEKARIYESEHITYMIDDALSLASLDGQHFDRIVCLLAIQNMDPIETLFQRIHELLIDGGRCVIVCMHPAFRSPRTTGWGVDEQRKLMYRRIDRYMTPMRVPIIAHPGREDSETLWTFHRPLSAYARAARQAHLYIDALEEWTSDKHSLGKHAAMENAAREEIPLFLAIRLKRLDHA